MIDSNVQWQLLDNLKQATKIYIIYCIANFGQANQFEFFCITILKKKYLMSQLDT